MIIQTLNCDFLIEESKASVGELFVYSHCKDELQRFFGSTSVEFSPKPDWKYRALTGKQYLVHAMIQMVKEVDYTSFSSKSPLLLR
jgi:hypothetical protein